jgi:branched-chain amino acid transport system permease protein
LLFQIGISGIALGSIYALLALALVLVHKATDVINFGQGEMAMFCTFIAYMMISRLGLPLYAVFLLSLPAGFIAGAAVDILVMGPLVGLPPLNSMIATLGVFTMLNSLAGEVWGYDAFRFPSLLPKQPVEMFGFRTAPDSFAVIGVSLGLMLLLYIFFEHTKEGTAMRAASMNRWAATLMGIKSSRVSLIAWGLGGAVGAMSGLLVAPIVFLDSAMMTPIIVKAFAAAILGGFNSLPGAILGGFTLGVVEVALAAGGFDKFKDAVSLILIVIVLMALPNGLFGQRAKQKV